MGEEKLTFTVSECAKRLGISRGLCYQAVRAGNLPSLRIGHRVLIPMHALEKKLAEAGNGK